MRTNYFEILRGFACDIKYVAKVWQKYLIYIHGYIFTSKNANTITVHTSKTRHPLLYDCVLERQLCKYPTNKTDNPPPPPRKKYGKVKKSRYLWNEYTNYHYRDERFWQHLKYRPPLVHCLCCCSSLFFSILIVNVAAIGREHLGKRAQDELIDWLWSLICILNGLKFKVGAKNNYTWLSLAADRGNACLERKVAFGPLWRRCLDQNFQLYLHKPWNNTNNNNNIQKKKNVYISVHLAYICT